MASRSPDKVVREGAKTAGILWAIRVLALGALGVSGYLGWTSLMHRGPAGCGAGSDCEELLASRWSAWFGVPVGALAAIVYAAILVLSLASGGRRSPGVRRRAWGGMTMMAVIAGGAAIWFIALQLGPMHRFCPYCMTVHACGLAIAVLVAIGLTKLTGRAVDGAHRMARGERPGRIGVLVLLGIVCLSALIAGQVLGPERPREFATYGAGGDAVTAPTSRERPNSATVPATVPSAATSPATPPAHPLARFPIGPREVELDPRELPALGPVEAPYAIAVMSDYTCPHCRAFHPLLERVRQRYGNQIVIIILPVPLDGRCNPRILQTQPRHIHACELAHLALAVWCADPASFAEMDRWLMDGAVVPTVEEVRARARQLVGADNLARAEADPRVEQVLRRTVGLYDLAGGGQIPKLIPPKRVAPAQVRDANDLFVYLERELGISPK